MVDRMLVAVEDSNERMRPVAEHAAELAAGLDAEVILYHVYDPDAFETRLERRGLDSADPATIAEQNATVEMCATVLREAGVSFSISASTGAPAEEILDYIGNHHIDHVFLGTQGRSPTGKVLLGSVSQEVMLGTDVPCTLVSH